MRWPWQRRSPVPERRDAASGYTAMILAARQEYISGVSGIAELTATVQACASLWEGAFASATVSGTGLLDRRSMALLARALAFRGEAVFLISGDRLIPCSDWELSTRGSEPWAYRLGISEAGGGTRTTALAAEVLHVRLAADATAPWTGQAPLRRASLSAQLLHELEAALLGVFRDAPLGSLVLGLDAGGGSELEQVRGSIRGRRGAALIIEHLSQAIAGGMPPPGGKVDHLTPRLREAAVVETLAAARDAICSVFGVLPALLNPSTTGPMVREGQRHLATWCLQPVAELVAEEATMKFGAPVAIDVLTPLQAYDQGGSARALAGIVQAFALAKEAGITPAELAPALQALDWSELAGGRAP